MSVSKRLRFEILRRDGNACRYCGGVAPDVILHIDHVIPVALGGTDDPTNLVAACKDCNIGKSSVHSDAPLVASVADDAIRWAKAMQEAFEREVAKNEKRDDYLDAFSDAWHAWRTPQDRAIPLPEDWQRSITKWYGLGLPIDLLREAIATTMPKTKVPNADKFRYMAGVVWSTITDLEQQTAALLAAPAVEDAPVRHCDKYPDIHCYAHDADAQRYETECLHCGQVGCDWMCGYDIGVQTAHRRWVAPRAGATHQAKALADVCDARVIAQMEAAN